MQQIRAKRVYKIGWGNIVYRDEINHKSNTNTYSYSNICANTGGLCHFRYERVYQRLALVHSDTRRETQFLKVFSNHTMLTPPQRAAHLLMFKISMGRDPKNPTTSFNGQNPILASTIQSQLTLFKILKFSGPYLRGMTSSTLQPHFLSGGLLWQTVIAISFERERNCTKWLCTWT